MFRKTAIVTTIALMLTGVSVVTSSQDADAQQARHRVHKKKTSKKKKQVRRSHNHHRRHSHRSHTRHSHGGHSYHHGSHYRTGVHVSVGSPYWYSRHHHGHHYYYNPGPHYVYRDTRVIVVDAAPADPVFVMPSLSCPIRTDEERVGNEQWCATPRGTRHGAYRRWYADGTLAAQGEYEYDQPEGIWLEFHANGALREEGEFDDGQRVGTWTTWGADGQELVSVNY